MLGDGRRHSGNLWQARLKTLVQDDGSVPADGSTDDRGRTVGRGRGHGSNGVVEGGGWLVGGQELGDIIVRKQKRAKAEVRDRERAQRKEKRAKPSEAKGSETVAWDDSE